MVKNRELAQRAMAAGAHRRRPCVFLRRRPLTNPAEQQEGASGIIPHDHRTTRRPRACPQGRARCSLERRSQLSASSWAASWLRSTTAFAQPRTFEGQSKLRSGRAPLI